MKQKSQLSKRQRAFMGDTMDSVGWLFGFEQLSFDAFEKCETAGDIADYLHNAMSDWVSLRPDSSDDVYDRCLKSLRSSMRWYLRKPLSTDDLDHPLMDVFDRKRKRKPVNTVKVWFDVLRTELPDSVPSLASQPWVKPVTHALGSAYIVFFLVFVLFAAIDGINWIELPDWVFVVAGVVGVSPFFAILIVSSLSARWMFENPEPELTLRKALVRYAGLLREKHGACDLEYIQSQLLDNWETERGGPATLSTPVPWLDK